MLKMAWKIRLQKSGRRNSSLMKRGDIYRTHKPESDPKRHRICVVVSRQVLIDSVFSTVICAPVFTNGEGISTQVAVGLNEGLKHDSWIVCDNLRSFRKTDLTQFLGSLSLAKLAELDEALRVALALD
jgi:mRNA interferase MazF